MCGVCYSKTCDISEKRCERYPRPEIGREIEQKDRGDSAGVVIRHKERVERKGNKFQLIEGAS